MPTHSLNAVCSRSASALSMLLLFFATSVFAAPILQVDVNDVGSPTNTQPGFTSLLQSDVEAGAGDTSSKTINGIAVNINGIPNGNDRVRATPTNNPPALTQAALYQDFGSTDGSATIDFSGLDGGAEYAVTVWSYDSSSNPDRTSEWSVRLAAVTPRC